MGKYINLTERWRMYKRKRELTLAKRLTSKKHPLVIDMLGFPAYFEAEAL